jgi:hypothetical protein
MKFYESSSTKETSQWLPDGMQNAAPLREEQVAEGWHISLTVRLICVVKLAQVWRQTCLLFYRRLDLFRGLRLTTRLHLAWRLRMGGAIPPLRLVRSFWPLKQLRFLILRRNALITW